MFSQLSLLVENENITSIPQIVELFNQYFASIRKNIKKLFHQLKKLFRLFKESLITNSIPTILLKGAKNTVSLALSKLINKSFEIGIFPGIFKLAKVVHVFKSETRLLCYNQRPVSLFSNVGKIIETLMHRRLNFSLNNRIFGGKFYYQ